MGEERGERQFEKPDREREREEIREKRLQRREDSAPYSKNKRGTWKNKACWTVGVGTEKGVVQSKF